MGKKNKKKNAAKHIGTVDFKVETNVEPVEVEVTLPKKVTLTALIRKMIEGGTNNVKEVIAALPAYDEKTVKRTYYAILAKAKKARQEEESVKEVMETARRESESAADATYMVLGLTIGLAFVYVVSKFI